MKFLVINGPNLNLTQFTEPGMEGQIDFNTLLDYIEAGCAQMDVQVDFFSPTTRVTSSMRSSRRQAGLMASSQPGRLRLLQRGHSGSAAGVRRARRGSDAGRPQRQGALPQRGCGLLWLSGPLCRRGVSGYLHACAYLVQLLRLDGGAQTHLVQ